MGWSKHSDDTRADNSRKHMPLDDRRTGSGYISSYRLKTRRKEQAAKKARRQLGP